MKKTGVVACLFIVIFIASCSQQKIEVEVTNQSSINLVQKSIVVERAKLEAKYDKLPEQDYAFLVDKDKHKYLAQLDDLDGDGIWDELFSQIDIKAGDIKIFNIEFCDSNAFTDFSVKTNIRFADFTENPKEFTSAKRLETVDTKITETYFQFEGVGWENDVVAFRNYFDARNGMDIFGKRTAEMVLDKCGLINEPTYHELQPWGMDILKVANSLGAGAIALQTPSGLYRVGPNCEGSFKLVKEGLVRSVLNLDFEGIHIDGKNISVKHRILIEAGKPYYNSEVWVKGHNDAKLVTGIVNLHSDSVYFSGSDINSWFYTYANQAYKGEKLGMAVIAPVNAINVQTAPEEGEGITQTFYAALSIKNQPVIFYFMAGWEKQDAVYSTKKGFENAIKKQADNLSAVVDIKI